MDKKYQIFISSTYQDLQKERQQAVQIILREGHIPVGMEFFGQDDRKQWEVIKEWIKASDIVLCMIKNRYGTICNDTGLSYTQMEYEFSVEMHKPIIKVVINDGTDVSDNPDKMQEFRRLILKDCVAGPVTNEGEMAQRIVHAINQYSNQIAGGWYRYGSPEDVDYEKKYKMMQFLMFAEDIGERGHNRFDIAPKVMMLQDMKKDFNQVEIGRLNIEYTIERSGTSTRSEKKFDGKRRWELSAVRNVSGGNLDAYTFYTATDIGISNGAKGQLVNIMFNRELQLDEKQYKNHGISRWKWRIYPSIPDNQLIDSIKMEEFVEEAWNIDRRKEIVYLIPNSFGRKIDILSISIETDQNVPILEMEMFKIVEANEKISRNSLGILQRIKMDNGKHKYGITLDNSIDMDTVYYIVIKKIK